MLLIITVVLIIALPRLLINDLSGDKVPTIFLICKNKKHQHYSWRLPSLFTYSGGTLLPRKTLLFNLVIILFSLTKF